MACYVYFLDLYPGDGYIQVDTHLPKPHNAHIGQLHIAYITFLNPNVPHPLFLQKYTLIFQKKQVVIFNHLRTNS